MNTVSMKMIRVDSKKSIEVDLQKMAKSAIVE
jgi:hypothetical protein